MWSRLGIPYLRQPVGVAVAATITGQWAWSLAIPAGCTIGMVDAARLAEADQQIAEALAGALPGRMSSFSLGRAGGWGGATKRSWESVDRPLPACEAMLHEQRSASRRTRRAQRFGAQARALRAEAAKHLPIEACLHPAHPRLVLPERDDPFTVASDGSFRDGKAAWAFVTGAGWADWDVTDVTNSGAAEFAAYCHALALFPDGAAVRLLTDSLPAGRVLQRIAEGGTRRQIARWRAHAIGAGVTHSLFDRTRLHAERLDVKVFWVRRKSHRLHAAADQLCGRLTGSRKDPGIPADDLPHSSRGRRDGSPRGRETDGRHYGQGRNHRFLTTTGT